MRGPGMRVAFVVGKPGAGKGTQAALLEAELSVRHISMGRLLLDVSVRQAASGDSTAAEAIVVGALVPSNTSRNALLAGIRAAVEASEDVVIEGVRRASTLAAGLSALAGPAAAIAGAFIDVPDDIVRERMQARAYCMSCDVYYGLLVPPRSDGRCAHGHELTRRHDDHDAAIESRLDVFRQEEPRLMDVAGGHNFFRVDGDRPPSEVFGDVMSGLLRRWDKDRAHVPGEAGRDRPRALTSRPP